MPVLSFLEVVQYKALGLDVVYEIVTVLGRKM